MRIVKMIERMTVHWNTCLIIILSLTTPMIVWSEPQRFINSREYNHDFHKGIIKDYSDMVEGEGVNWVWIDPSVNLINYRIKVNRVINSSEVNR